MRFCVTIIFVIFYSFSCNAGEKVEKSSIKPLHEVDNVPLFLGMHAIEAEDLFTLKEKEKVLISLSYDLKLEVSAIEQSYTFNTESNLCEVIGKIVANNPVLGEINNVFMIWYKDRSVKKYRLRNLSRPVCEFDQEFSAGDVLIIHYHNFP